MPSKSEPWDDAWEWSNPAAKWDKRFLALAAHIGTWSRDPSTKVGCVIVDDQKRVVSVGYNGFPAGVEDLPERYNDRALKYEMVVHSEPNAIMFAQRDLRGCTIYTHPFPPCSRCAAQIINAGIKRVVAPDGAADRWKGSCGLATQMFTEAGVSVDYV